MPKGGPIVAKSWFVGKPVKFPAPKSTSAMGPYSLVSFQECRFMLQNIRGIERHRLQEEVRALGVLGGRAV
jgi:hypothetical protein